MVERLVFLPSGEFGKDEAGIYKEPGRRGRTGAIKTSTWWGKSITLKNGAEEIKLNRGSLIDFLNQVRGNGTNGPFKDLPKLKKGWFWGIGGSSNRKITQTVEQFRVIAQQQLMQQQLRQQYQENIVQFEEKIEQLVTLRTEIEIVQRGGQGAFFATDVLPSEWDIQEEGGICLIPSRNPRGNSYAGISAIRNQRNEWILRLHLPPYQGFYTKDFKETMPDVIAALIARQITPTRFIILLNSFSEADRGVITTKEYIDWQVIMKHKGAYDLSPNPDGIIHIEYRV